MLGRMQNGESESRIESPNPRQRRYAGRTENAESESRIESPNPCQRGMPGEWRIEENHNRELRVRTLVKGGMLREWKIRIRIEN